MPEKLTGRDYMTHSFLDLQSHPDFNAHCMRVIDAISKMTNSQLQHIDICSIITRSNAERDS